MKLPEPIETVGFFWLPTNPEDRLPGTLRISSVGKVTIEVIGTFGGWQNAFQGMGIGSDPLPSGSAPNHDRIVGITDQGDAVTLEGCLSTGSRINFPSKQSKSSFLATFAFIGGNYDSGSELRFAEVRFSIEGLNEWLSLSWFSGEQNRETKSGKIEYHLPEDNVFNLPNEVRLTLKHVLSHPSFGVPVASVSVNQAPVLCLELDRVRPIADFLPLVSRLCNFLSLAVNQPVSTEFISGYLEEDGETVDELRSPIRLYYQSSTHDSEKPEIKVHEMLFSFGDVAENCERLLSNWLQVYESIEPAFNLFFASKSDKYQYIDVRFLRLAQGIETLHRRSCRDVTEMPKAEFGKLRKALLEKCPEGYRDFLSEKLSFANELSLRRRISSLVEPFEDFFGGACESTKFVSKVVNTRNYLTHYSQKLESKAASGEELWRLCQKLDALFTLHILSQIGFDPDFKEEGKPLEGYSRLCKRLRA